MKIILILLKAIFENLVKSKLHSLFTIHFISQDFNKIRKKILTLLFASR